MPIGSLADARAILEVQQIPLRFDSTGETSQGAMGADDTVTWRDDRDGISSVGSTYRPRGRWPTDFAGDVPIAASLAKRDRKQRRPYLLLKWGAPEIERKHEYRPFAGKIFANLAVGLQKNGVIWSFCHARQHDTSWPVILPKNGSEAKIAGNEGKCPNGRAHSPIFERHIPIRELFVDDRVAVFSRRG